MPRNLRTRAVLVLVVLIGSAWALYPPKKTINLGLDLQGGIHLVLGVQTDKHIASQTDRAAEDFKAALERRGIAAKRVVREGLQAFTVELASPQSWNDALTVANEFQTFDRDLSRLGLAAYIEPQDAKGQSGVNRGLRLLRVHAHDGKTGLSPSQEATGINWAERLLEIDGGGKP